MIKVLDEHERTMAFAEVALGQIKSLRQTAVPRNYEIWYVYATGYNAPLNKVINETLARNGRLTEADLEQIYETYLSHIKTTDRIDKVGARVIGEIDDVMTLLTEALGMSLKQTIKGQDITARYGGEEFAVVLPNTALRQALTVADHIRRAVMHKELMKRSTGQHLGRITISIGVASLRKGDSAQALIERADTCLYAAKRNGRNRVICEVDPEYSAEIRSQVA